MPILLLVFWVNVAVHAMDNGAVRCAKVLISLREHRRASVDDPAIEAVRTMHSWRTNELRKFGCERSDDVVTGHSASKESILQQVTARASGVLADANLGRAKLWGVRLVGAEAIRREVERRAGTGRGLRAAHRARSKTQQYGAFLTSGSGLTVTAALAMMSTQFDSALVALPALAVPVVMLRHLPEHFYRLFQAYHPEGDERTLDAWLEHESDPWAYRAYDVRVPVRALRRIAHTGDVGEDDIDDFHREVSYPLETVARTTEKWLALPPGEPPGPVDWVRFDELLYRPARGEPIFVSLARLPFSE